MACPVLVDMSSKGSLNDIPVSSDKFLIGRGLNNNYVLKEFDVSRTHCMLEKNGDKWFISDKSSNGTHLNDQLLDKSKSHEMNFGDIISLGRTIKLMFQTSARINDLLSEPLTNRDLADATDSIMASIEALQNDCDSDNSQKTVLNKIIDAPCLDAIFSPGSSAEPNHNAEPQAGTNLNQPAIEQPPAPPEPIEAQAAAASTTSNTHLSFAEDELQCSICTEMFVQAVTLVCSHTFCKYCITEWNKRKWYCPICKDRITMQFPTRVIDNFIDKIIETASEDVKRQRQELVAQRQVLEPEYPHLNPDALCNKAAAGLFPIRNRGLRRRAERPIEISSDEMESESDSDASSWDSERSNDGSYNGLPGQYYGGYGHCFACGQAGHWANGCPQRIRNFL